MSMQDQLLILYDLPTKREDIDSWSPNVWKTRLALNYKKIPYKTVWLKHADIAPTLSGLGISPNESKSQGPPQSPYTLPAVKFPDGTFAMDSAKIAVELEKRYPSPKFPSLKLEEGTQDEVMKLFGGVAVPLLPMIYDKIASNILLEESVTEWKAKKSKQMGMPFEEWVAKNGGEGAWEKAGEGIGKLVESVKGRKKDEGPFILGRELSCGDFVVAGLLESCRRIDKGLYERMLSFDNDGVLKGVHEACGKWFDRDD
ncbi:hypothetical protein DOTSEDRAFT_55362 [Dothistroma septosporum NZE10]|uniref:Uncharacterized protein n=1 Tax=Dothistroma septosporum (strain NZE10 / CBS 128990) TaxID=675120 RepID=N1PJT4_DOTSN|nr:hypothetical protein DOTSEDRAFT_55362 [Dothistroma septosporum NZE10]